MGSSEALQQGTQSKRGVALVLTAAFMWGIMGVFARGLDASGYSSVDMSFLRCVLAGGAFFVFTFFTNRKALRLDGKGAVICFLYGVVAYTMSFVTYGIAITRIPVAVAIVLMFMSPIWIALLSALFFKEPLTKKTAVVIALCILGAGMVSNVFSSGGSLDLLGVAMGILNGFGLALQILLPRFFADRYERDTMLVYGFLGSALFLGFFADFTTIAQSFRGEDALRTLLYLLAIGILCTMVANVSFVKAALYLPATTCSILSAIEVVIAAVVGYVLFDEALGVLQILGAFVIVAASLGPMLIRQWQATKWLP